VPKLHIVCLRPGGMNRGGTRHEGHKVHDFEAFTVAQLRDMHNEPNLVLIVGGDLLTEAVVAEMERVEAEGLKVAEEFAGDAARTAPPKKAKG